MNWISVNPSGNVCHGCGNKYDDCICEELDAEMNEGKYPDCDPNDGDYKTIDERDFE